MDGDHGQCPSWQQLRDFHRGDVNEDCCDRIGEHLCECTDCLNRVETLEASHDTLQRPDVDDQPHANSATGNGGAEAEHWFDAWRKFLDEAELIQLCQNAMNMVAHESSAAWRMHSPDDLTAGNSSQSNFTTPLRDTTAKSPAKAEQTRTMVGNYLIVRQLGHGAFSSVYLAEHRGSGRQVPSRFHEKTSH